MDPQATALFSIFNRLDDLRNPSVEPYSDPPIRSRDMSGYQRLPRVFPPGFDIDRNMPLWVPHYEEPGTRKRFPKEARREETISADTGNYGMWDTVKRILGGEGQWEPKPGMMPGFEPPKGREALDAFINIASIIIDPGVLKAAKAGNAQAWETVIKALKPVFGKAAKKYTGLGLQDEAMGQAHETAFKAMQSWDPEGGTSFPSWVTKQLPRDLARTVKPLSDVSHLPTNVGERVYDVNRLRRKNPTVSDRDLAAQLGYDPAEIEAAQGFRYKSQNPRIFEREAGSSAEETAIRYGVDPSEYRAETGVFGGPEAMSYKPERTFGLRGSDTKSSLERGSSKSKTDPNLKVLREWIATLPPKQQQALTMHLDGKTVREMGVSMGMSHVAAMKHRNAALEALESMRERMNPAKPARPIGGGSGDTDDLPYMRDMEAWTSAIEGGFFPATPRQIPEIEKRNALTRSFTDPTSLYLPWHRFGGVNYQGAMPRRVNSANLKPVEDLMRLHEREGRPPMGHLKDFLEGRATPGAEKTFAPLAPIEWLEYMQRKRNLNTVGGEQPK